MRTSDLRFFLLLALLLPAVVFSQKPESGGTLLSPARYARVPKKDLDRSDSFPDSCSLLQKATADIACFPRGQGYVPVCNGCAISNALAVQRKFEFEILKCPNYPPELFAPCYLYVQCRQFDKNGVENGAYIPEMLDTLCAQGICLKLDWGPDDCHSCGQLPNAGQKIKAGSYAIDSYSGLISEDSFKLKTTKKTHNAYLKYRENWLRQQISTNKSVIAVLLVTDSTGHAVAVTGYNTPKKEIEFLDSQDGPGGMNCCSGSIKTMSYTEFFERLAEAYVLVLKPLECTDRH